MQKIVVIEDSSFMRARFVSLLHSHGYTETEEFVLADDIARKPHLYLKDAALIIADIQLPGISGLDLVNTIKKDARYAHIPVFFVSGYGDAKTISAAARTGAADYLVKPFDNDVFLQKVKNLLDRADSIPEEFLIGDDEFAETVSLEYQRALRGNQFLSLVKLKLHKPDIRKCIKQIKRKLRRIDTVCIFKDSVILILPITNGAGAAVVLEKVKTVLKNSSVELQESASDTYPGESALTPEAFMRAALTFAQ
jgi:DNA-binding response OmpR family regulator